MKDPATGQMTTKWTQNQALSRDQQEIFDYQTQRNADLSYLAAGKGKDIQREMSQPLNWGQFGDVVGFDPETNRTSAEDAAYSRATQRLDPQYEKELATLERKMAGRGLRAGDSAYDSAMSNFYNGKNDAYEMARLGAVSEGRQEVGLNLSTNERANALRQQEISEYLSKRGQSLSEANALSGSMNTAEMSSTYGGGAE